MFSYSDFRTDTLLDGAADDASRALILLSDNKRFMRKLTRPIGLSRDYQDRLARKIHTNKKLVEFILTDMQEVGEEIEKRGDDEATTALSLMFKKIDAQAKRCVVHAN